MHDPYFELTIPLFKKSLTQLDHLVSCAEAFVAEKGIAESVILEARLAPDMFPFVRQIQIACDNAKGSTARLGGVEVPKMEDSETSLIALHERIGKTLSFLESFTPEQFAYAAEQKVELPYFKDKYFVGHDFLMHYAIPNFHFHFVTAYALLRMMGVPIGKKDYLGPLPLHDIA